MRRSIETAPACLWCGRPFQARRGGSPALLLQGAPDGILVRTSPLGRASCRSRRLDRRNPRPWRQPHALTKPRSCSWRCSRSRARDGMRSPQRCPRSYSTGSSAGTHPAWRKIGRRAAPGDPTRRPAGRMSRHGPLPPPISLPPMGGRSSPSFAEAIDSPSGLCLSDSSAVNRVARRVQDHRQAEAY